jgi:hypothetical protein
MTLGLEENSSKEMGLWVEGVRKLREASGGCVLVVHHTGRNGGDARGSSAIDAAQDMEWKVERKPGRLQATLKCEKSKDGDDRTRFTFAMDVVVVGKDEDGQEITSLVLGDESAFEQERPAISILDQMGDDAKTLSNQEWILRTIALAQDPDDGITRARLKTVMDEARKGADQAAMPKGTYESALARLLADGSLTKPGTGRVALPAAEAQDDLDDFADVA